MNASEIPVIVTRAQPGADETAARLLSNGLTPLLAPVMHVAPDHSVTLPDLAGIGALVFTSANGVRAFTDRSDLRDQAAWCVGPATARAAREAGFSCVEESAGDARDLAAFIKARAQASDSPLLHIANRAAKGDLKAALIKAGFQVTFCPLYRMVRAQGLPDSVIETLRVKTPALVLVHSEKGAEAFTSLTQGQPVTHLTLVAISARAARPLVGAGLKDIHIAAAPNEDGLFNSVSSAVAILSA